MAVPTMSAKEVVTMDDMQKSGETPKDILAKLQRERAKRGEDGPGCLAVYNFLSGVTHRRDMVENRGRQSQMPRRNAAAFLFLKGGKSSCGQQDTLE